MACLREPTLPEVEGGLNEKDDNQDNGERQVRDGGKIPKRFPRDEDEDRGNEKHSAETAKEVADGLEPPAIRRRRESV